MGVVLAREPHDKALRPGAGPLCGHVLAQVRVPVVRRRVELVPLGRPDQLVVVVFLIDPPTISPTPRITRSTLSVSVPSSAMHLMMNAFISAGK